MEDEYKVHLYRRSTATGGSSSSPESFDTTVKATSTDDASRKAKAQNPGCEVREMPKKQS